MKNVKRTIAVLLFALTLIVPSLVQADSWDIDPAHSLVGFRIRHMMLNHGFTGMLWMAILPKRALPPIWSR